MKLYRVSVFADASSEHPRGLAVWDRFAETHEQVVASTICAAEREWPNERDFEVCVNRVLVDEPATCAVCGDQLTTDEQRRLNLDVDFVEHGDRGHLIRREV